MEACLLIKGHPTSEVTPGSRPVQHTAYSQSCSVDNKPGIRYVGDAPADFTPLADSGFNFADNATNPYWSTRLVTKDAQGQTAISAAECNCRCATTNNCVYYWWSGSTTKTCWLFSWMTLFSPPQDMFYLTAGQVTNAERDAVLARVALQPDAPWYQCANADLIHFDSKIPKSTGSAAVSKQPPLIESMDAATCNAWCGTDKSCVAFTLQRLNDGSWKCTLLSEARGGLKAAGPDMLTYPLQTCKNATSTKVDKSVGIQSAPAVPPPADDVWYTLSDVTGLCLSQPHQGDSDMIIEECANVPLQTFYLKKLADSGAYELRTSSRSDASCVSAAENAPARKSRVVLAPCDDLPAQRWDIQKNRDDPLSYSMVSFADPSLVMDTVDGVSKPNAKLVLWTNQATDSQVWRFSLAKPPGSAAKPISRPVTALPTIITGSDASTAANLTLATSNTTQSSSSGFHIDRTDMMYIAIAVGIFAAVISLSFIIVLAVYRQRSLRSTRSMGSGPSVTISVDPFKTPTKKAGPAADIPEPESVQRINSLVGMRISNKHLHLKPRDSADGLTKSLSASNIARIVSIRSPSKAVRSVLSAGAEQSHMKIRWTALRSQRTIGSGSLGRVTAGLWEGKKVVVKSLNMSKVTPDMAESLTKEVLDMKDCVHPAIAKVYGLVNDPPHYAIVMQQYRKASLAQFMMRAEYEAVPMLQRLRMCIQIASGMSYLHERVVPILHLNLKPSNILMEENGGSVVISDYGIVEWALEEGAIRPTLTNITYIAPEIVKDMDGDRNAAVDVYAFAMLLLEIMSGKPAYKGLADKQIIPLVVDGRRPSIPVEIPQGVADVIEDCWSEDPEARPNFAHVVEKLNAVESQLVAGDLGKDWERTSAAVLKLGGILNHGAD